MNLIQGKSNQFLRESILEGSLEKTKRYLTLTIGKADADAVTDTGGFTMLHCAALVGNTQIVMLLLQHGADVMALTNDGYTALDLAIWKGHLQVIELLRSQASIAPMKEPDSLNGKVIMHLSRRATVVAFEPGTSIQPSSLRALYYEDAGEAKLVNLWAGTDYKIIGNNPFYEDLKKFEYVYEELPVTQAEIYDSMLQGEAFFDNDDDSDDDDDESDSDDDDIVEVRVPPGPLGVLLDSGAQDCALIHSFNTLPNGEKGAIELHGGVEPGMYIVSINDVNASLMSLQQVTQLLGKLARSEKVIRFAYYKETASRATSDASDDDEDADEPTATSSQVQGSSNPSDLSFTSRMATIAASVMESRPSNASDTSTGATL